MSNKLIVTNVAEAIAASHWSPRVEVEDVLDLNGAPVASFYIRTFSKRELQKLSKMTGEAEVGKDSAGKNVLSVDLAAMTSVDDMQYLYHGLCSNDKGAPFFANLDELEEFARLNADLSDQLITAVKRLNKRKTVTAAKNA